MKRRPACMLGTFVSPQLAPRADAPAVWELALAPNLHGWGYWFQVDGPRDAFGAFAPCPELSSAKQFARRHSASKHEATRNPNMARPPLAHP